MQELTDVKGGVIMDIRDDINKKTNRGWFMTLALLVLSLVALNYTYTDKAVEASKQLLTAQNKEQDATTNALKEILKGHEQRMTALEEKDRVTNDKLDRNYDILQKLARGKR